MKIIAFAIALFVGLYTILVLITTSYYGNEQGNSLVLNRPITHTLRGSLLDCAGINAFYRAMLCIRGTSHSPVSVRPSVCLSVRLSVTSRCSTKKAKSRIPQTTPHDTAKTLHFCCQRSPRNSTGITPCGGAECRWVGQNRRLLTNSRLYLENGTR